MEAAEESGNQTQDGVDSSFSEKIEKRKETNTKLFRKTYPLIYPLSEHMDTNTIIIKHLKTYYHTCYLRNAYSADIKARTI